MWDVLSRDFARVDSPTRVRLSMHGLDIAWIPTLPNVDFVLLSDEDVSESEARCETHYFFDTFRRSARWITVEFGHGTRCSNSGRIYSFRYKRGRLVRDSGGPDGFGSGGGHCGCP